jgi:TRAP-type C4-dicarboxylate transport system permease large subunit
LPLRPLDRLAFRTRGEALYALVIGGIVFRELGPRAALHSFVNAATRSDLVLFIVAPRSRLPSR